MRVLPQNWQSNSVINAHIPAYTRHLPVKGGHVIVCWSLKGGSGTTVVSAALALTLSQRNNAAVRIVDLAGDIPSTLGIAEPSGDGVTNWLQQPQRAPIQSMQIPVTTRVSLIPRGSGSLMHHDLTSEHCNTLATELDISNELTVVDAGSGHIPQLINNATTSLLVIRPCYLALRKAAHISVKPHGIVLINEPGRSLGKHDVESVIGAPVLVELPLDPTIARCVDAGLLASRIPTMLSQHLAHVA
jgi:Mrp family chromosome partitioning ATPase